MLFAKDVTLFLPPLADLKIQVHQEWLGPAAATDRWRSTAHQRNVVENDDFVVSRFVRDWTKLVV
jgi:hypothetical protein